MKKCAKAVAGLAHEADSAVGAMLPRKNSETFQPNLLIRHRSCISPKFFGYDHFICMMTMIEYFI